ncbi:MAG: aconitate hydratase AcnA [Calditrichaeota bacterium]|nr:aconitate hydratase AcnA [Calditrichota bacterium]RQW03082.1 MAG: aconitate hydratase AcnA [Calditrichota bacterium]
MASQKSDSFNTQKILKNNGDSYTYFSLPELDKQGLLNLDKMPFSIRILLENMLRKENGQIVTHEDVEKVIQYHPIKVSQAEIPFMPARVILQDFTGVPAVVDLAAMRDALKELGGEAEQINPVVPADLVIDHSVQVDVFGTLDAYERNVQKEYQRNGERYQLLKWAQKSFRNFRVVPPGMGIVHQVNLEYLGSVVMHDNKNGDRMAHPDTLVGTDSHTTMINGLSVLGWGVGGIEAEAVMLGQPYYMVLPEVVGVKLSGLLPEGATATDLVLTITEMLRKVGVVGKFVEYFGTGLSNLSLPDRATIANMSPEYGATMGFFPVDSKLLDYLKMTSRTSAQISLVERYSREQGLFRTDDTPDPSYSTVLELDLSTIEVSLSGPRRPQDRIPLAKMKSSFYISLKELFGKPLPPHVKEVDGQFVSAKEKQPEPEILTHGSVVIAAITSCTNTSNPSVMLSAGLLAKNAMERGIKTKPWVKTSLAPGSRVVTDYLESAGLMDSLNEQGFSIVGYGCTTCIGNSGPLPEHIDKTIHEEDLVVVAVLSGNRNFEGRIHASVRANYLASPPLVVAYALAGRADIDFENEPLGTGRDGNPVYLRDIWPDQKEIVQKINTSLDPEMFEEKYSEVFSGDHHWQSMEVTGGKRYKWDEKSTYIRKPPFFSDMSMSKNSIKDIKNARVLAYLGDSVTTDHISPAGTIQPKSPAGQYLLDHGVEIKDFNSYGSRRGNHEVMMRGTFANIRIRNKLLDGIEGGYTRYFPTNEQMTIYDASIEYQKGNIPLIVIAGKEYGTGSSRDWAAKGTLLLGIRAIIAESFERIHRSNLVGMGILPLQFLPGDSAEKIGLTGEEIFSITGLEEGLKPGQELKVQAIAEDGVSYTFNVKSRLDTPVDVLYYENGGILQTVLRQMAKK